VLATGFVVKGKGSTYTQYSDCSWIITSEVFWSHGFLKWPNKYWPQQRRRKPVGHQSSNDAMTAFQEQTMTQNAAIFLRQFPPHDTAHTARLPGTAEPYHVDSDTRAQRVKAQFPYAPAATCGLLGCKNWLAPFPGRMSYKATKPGLALSVVYLSMFYCIAVY